MLNWTCVSASTATLDLTAANILAKRETSVQVK